MKTLIKQSLILSFFCITIFGVIYPLITIASAKIFTGKSEGSPVIINGEIRGFENIGQKFTDDKYFNGRPSAVDYNAASTGGSNKSTSNPEYLALVKSRIDTFLIHNPEIKKENIPSERVTASGSGIDPDITPEAALVQIPRISKTRNINSEILNQLISDNTESKFLGFAGTERINILKLNSELDKIK